MSHIEVRRAIEELHSRFAHAVDRSDYALLRLLYTRDATEQHGPYCGPVDGYVEWLRRIQADFEMMHHVFSHLIFAVDGDEAESEVRGMALLRFRANPPYNVMVATRHFDRYRSVDGEWLFARRSLCVDWAQKFTPAEQAPDLVGAFLPGVMGPTDPVYRQAPKVIEAIRSGRRPTS